MPRSPPEPRCGGRRREVWSSNRPLRKAERSPDGEGLGAVLDGLLTRRPLRSGMALGLLGRRWEEVVGERLAHECAPAGLEGGVLLVRASSQAWGAQIRFLAREIASAAERVTGPGTVRDVRIAIDSGPPRRNGRSQ